MRCFTAPLYDTRGGAQFLLLTVMTTTQATRENRAPAFLLRARAKLAIFLTSPQVTCRTHAAFQSYCYPAAPRIKTCLHLSSITDEMPSTCRIRLARFSLLAELLDELSLFRLPSDAMLLLPVGALRLHRALLASKRFVHFANKPDTAVADVLNAIFLHVLSERE